MSLCHTLLWPRTSCETRLRGHIVMGESYWLDGLPPHPRPLKVKTSLGQLGLEVGLPPPPPHLTTKVTT